VKETFLEIDYDYDFKLLSISSTEKDYRMAWLLNNQLEWQLTRSEKPLELFKQGDELHAFYIYTFIDEVLQKEYMLIPNQSLKYQKKELNFSLFDEEMVAKALLIPELLRTDYFIMLKGNVFDEDLIMIESHLNRIPEILMCSAINPTALKSRKNLIF
jgi:hypothetical protein